MEKSKKIEYICSDCGNIGTPVKRYKGPLWLSFLLLLTPPIGLLYTIWLIVTRESVCPVCKSARIVPLNTPGGVQLLKQLRPDIIEKDPGLPDRLLRGF